MIYFLNVLGWCSVFLIFSRGKNIEKATQSSVFLYIMYSTMFSHTSTIN